MKTLTLATLALAALSTTCALADEPRSSAREVRTVSYAGLDLNTEAGARVLFLRLHTAAQGVCKHLHTLELGQRRAAWDSCVRDATARAVVDVGVPSLTDYANARLGDLVKPAKVAKRN